MFEFRDLNHMSSDDNLLYKSPSVSAVPSSSSTTHDLGGRVEPTIDLQPSHNSQLFRKFSSEPSLRRNPSRSRCGFRERMKSDCLEDEMTTDLRRKMSETDQRLRTRKKSCHRHDHQRPVIRHQHARLKSQAHVKSQWKCRRPLTDCTAHVNSSLSMNEAVLQPTTLSLTTPSLSTPSLNTPSLSEAEIRAVCVDVFMER